MSKMAIVVLISLVSLSTVNVAHSADPMLRGADGKLASCDGVGPHCVSSTSREAGRYVAPIRFSGSSAAAQQAMSKIVGGFVGAKIVEQSPGYIHAEFTSTLLRFVDDVELVFADSQPIQVRSSSRIGYYDFGANRARVEALRKAFGEVLP
jgi:uncharacterized protein (DUF1499 family)